MNYLATIGMVLGALFAFAILLNLINIFQAGGKRPDGRSMAQILGKDPEKATVDDIEKLSRREKMQLFYAAEEPRFQEIEGEFAARILSGGILGAASAWFTHHIFPTGRITLDTHWIGKGFHAQGVEEGRGYNIFSIGGVAGKKRDLRTREMETHMGATKVGWDGKKSFHLDYSAHNGGPVRSMRDEIRKVNDRLFIGAGYMGLGGGSWNPAPFVLIGPPKPWVGPDPHKTTLSERVETTSGADHGKVFIKRCESYDRDLIQAAIREGMAALGYQPDGNVFVKPNVVFATKNGRYGDTAYTNPAVVGATLVVLSQAPGVDRVDMGEKTAIGYPTRLTYRYAGYYDELRSVRRNARTPVDIFCIDECLRDRVFVGGMVHDTLRIARKMARADTKVYLPKLKCHCVSTMTGAVKLNIGICSDDERAIRHDFMLNDKIVDLLAVGYPDFIVMDAIEVGVGNEAVPTPRKLGLLVMGTNPMSVDMVGARLLGYDGMDVPYLKRAVERGYRPESLADVLLCGDLQTVEELDQAAGRLLPHDDGYTSWQNIEKELARLHSPIRFYWGYTKADKSRCETGCVMGAKMFFGFLERYAGERAFKKARPVVMIIGNIEETIDARGQEAFLIGSCSRATVINARKITRIDNCFTTAVDIAQVIRGRLGIPAPILDPGQVLPLVGAMSSAAVMKLLNFRYFQDIWQFVIRGLQKRI